MSYDWWGGIKADNANLINLLVAGFYKTFIEHAVYDYSDSIHLYHIE